MYIVYLCKANQMSGHTVMVGNKLVATVTGPPLDYGWKEMKQFKEVVDETPWTKEKEANALADMKKKMEAKHVQKDPAEGEGGEKNAGKDGGTTSKGDDKAEESKDSGEQKNKDAEGGGVSRAPKVPSLVLKEIVVGIKFNNNEFNTWSGFDEALDAAMPDSKNLQFLDCSFNKFQTLGSVLGEYPELRVLYLHGNKIGRLKDIDRLKGLKSIRKLTLHGNPVEDKKNYRKYVIYNLPSLQQLDFTPITNVDRDHAKTWAEREIRNRNRRRENGGF